MELESDIEIRKAILDKHIQQLKLREISKYKSNWRLLFQTLPQIEEVRTLFKDLFSKKDEQNLDQNLKEIKFLQYLLIALDAPASLFMEEYKWQLVKDLMPTNKTKLQIKVIANSFLIKSAYNNPWSKNEDKTLKKIISAYSLKNKGKKWSKIAQKLAELSTLNFIRTPKQCRERWSNKLNPIIQRDEWTDEEELYFVELLLQNGKKWAEISSRLSTLTENKKRTEFALKHKFKKLILKRKKTVEYMTENTTYQICPTWTKEEVEVILEVIHNYHKVVSTIHNPRQYSENYKLSPLIQRVRKGTENQLAIIKKNQVEFIDIGILNIIMAEFVTYQQK